MLPPEYLAYYITISIFGFMLWIANKYMKCNSWYFGYFLVLVQGAGFGGIVQYLFFDNF
jgi:hypothetical protein